ncbi:MAG TPA: hypothetical protein VM370_09645 [Candidatus Thermoplasmatota archaeon]|nr:hypothetical protein [Candidatus Thermoplasmatota archaeon]
MPPGKPRTVEETTPSGKRLLRDYDPSGKLTGIRILPALPAPTAAKRGLFGRARKELPTPAPDASPAPASSSVTTGAPPPEPAPLSAPPPPPAIHARFPDEAAKPGIDIVVERFGPAKAPPSPQLLTPAPDASPAPTSSSVTTGAPSAAPSAAPPPPPAVHTRLPEEPARPGIDVLLEPLSDPPAPRQPPLVLPEVVALRADIVVPAPEPDERAIVFREPEPVAAAGAEPEIVYVPPRRFEVVALEEVVEAAPAPGPERVPEPKPESKPEPEPEPKPEPEPEPEDDRLRPPYVAAVPDVDQRVDALLTRADAPAKRRKRAPVPAPSFEPLAREPWEDRLDAALAGR